MEAGDVDYHWQALTTSLELRIPGSRRILVPPAAMLTGNRGGARPVGRALNVGIYPVKKYGEGDCLEEVLEKKPADRPGRAFFLIRNSSPSNSGRPEMADHIPTALLQVRLSSPDQPELIIHAIHGLCPGNRRHYTQTRTARASCIEVLGIHDHDGHSIPGERRCSLGPRPGWAECWSTGLPKRWRADASASGQTPLAGLSAYS